MIRDPAPITHMRKAKEEGQRRGAGSVLPGFGVVTRAAFWCTAKRAAVALPCKMPLMTTFSHRRPPPSSVRNRSDFSPGFSFASHITKSSARSIMPSGFGMLSAGEIPSRGCFEADFPDPCAATVLAFVMVRPANQPFE